MYQKKVSVVQMIIGDLSPTPCIIVIPIINVVYLYIAFDSIL